MLADTKEKYEECEKSLISDFKRVYGLESLEDDEGIVQWVERLHPRRYWHIWTTGLVHVVGIENICCIQEVNILMYLVHDASIHANSLSV